MPTAFITGITGQDGTYLTRLLLQRGYQVYGGVRDVLSARNSHGLAAFGIGHAVNFLKVELASLESLRDVLETSQPDEIYHLASQSSVDQSFSEPLLAAELTGLGSAYLLEAYREKAPRARFVFASSCHIFGMVDGGPQHENTPINPRSPHAAAKAYGQSLTQTYRDVYGLHASCAIMYNHESPLRPETFVTRKISMAVARIKHGLQQELRLGNLEIARDWGFAGDYVEALALMAQQEAGNDYILSTGEMHTLREFVNLAFEVAGLAAEDFVRIDPAFFRPVDQMALVGDPSKAWRCLGWKTRVSFEDLVKTMVETDIARIQAHTLQAGGFI